MEQIYTIALMLGSAFLFGLILANILTKGMFLNNIIVKMSKGRKLLVYILNENKNYIVIGKLEEKKLLFKDNAKKAHTMPINFKNNIFNFNNVSYCIYENEKDMILSKDQQNLDSRFNSILADEMIQRALMLPRLNMMSNKELIMIILIILCFIGIIYIGWRLGKVSNTIDMFRYEFNFYTNQTMINL